MKNTNTSNNAKTNNSFEQFNANEEYIEYQKAMENLRKAQDKFLNKQREFMKRWHEENAKRYNAEMAKVMQKYNTSFNQYHPGQYNMCMQGPRMGIPLSAPMPFSSVMPPYMNMHPHMCNPYTGGTYYPPRDIEVNDLFRHYDAEDEKLFHICNTIVNDPIHNRDGVAGLAMLAAKVANIVNPTAEIKFAGMDDAGVRFSITRRGPFGERIKHHAIKVEQHRL